MYEADIQLTHRQTIALSNGWSETFDVMHKDYFLTPRIYKQVGFFILLIYGYYFVCTKLRFILLIYGYYFVCTKLRVYTMEFRQKAMIFCNKHILTF
jgi:hypothetical protein